MQGLRRGAIRLALFALVFALLEWLWGEPAAEIAPKVAVAAPLFAVLYGLAERWLVQRRPGG